MTALSNNLSGKHAPLWVSSRALVLLLVTMLLAGCSGALNWDNGGAGQSPGAGRTARGAAGATGASAGNGAAATSAGQVQLRQAAQTATAMIGTPYRYGGSSPKAGFDCSGLVQYSYLQAGMRAPRTSRAQFDAARPISLAEAEPGDLLFFRYDRKISHVAIYLGDDRFVHAPSRGKQVSVASLKDPHYQQHFLQAGRLQ
jgi:cell wall-associated NlpC family hydrolase